MLVLMLFDKAISSLETALPAFEFKDPKEKNERIHNNLRRAIDIVRFLNNSLNLQEGGELAGTLRNLYLYFEDRLVNSSNRKNREGVDEVIGHMRPIRDAWAEMLDKQGRDVKEELQVA